MMRYFFLITTLIILSAAGRAYAMAELEFTRTLPPHISIKLNFFLSQNFNTTVRDYEFSRVDLNNDNNDEYILRRTYCVEKELFACNYTIIGETKNNFVSLGQVRAKKLVISTTKTHHIKDILAFKNQLNDYDFDIYMWSPKEKMYILNAK